MLDPNCVPRHHVHPRAFPYHAHYYHPPAQPACRDPWPEGHLQDIPLTDLPRSPVPAEPHDLGHSASVIWPGYAPDPPTHAPHGGPDDRTVVSVPEPSAFALLIVGIATLFALRLRPSGDLAAVARLNRLPQNDGCRKAYANDIEPKQLNGRLALEAGQLLPPPSLR
jgi:hypothetical protein